MENYVRNKNKKKNKEKRKKNKKEYIQKESKKKTKETAEKDFKYKKKDGAPSTNEKKKEIPLCKHKSKCRDLRKGICRFGHTKEDFELIQDKKDFVKMKMENEIFVPKKSNQNKQKFSKVFLGQLVKINKEEKLQEQLKLRDIKNILNDDDLSLFQLLDLFTLFTKISNFKNQKFKEFFMMEMIRQKYFTDKKVYTIRNIIQNDRSAFSRQNIDNLIRGFLNLWNMIKNLIHLIPEAIEQIETNLFYKLSKFIVNKSDQFTSLCLDDEDEKLKIKCEELNDICSKISKKREEVVKEQNEKNRMKRYQMENNPYINTCDWDPPNEFKEFSDYPTCDEIEGKSDLYIKPIPIKKSFNNINHYLDLNYRLLREDFISCLRNGLKTHMRLSKLKSANEKNFDLILYKNVQTVSFVSNIHFSGLCLRIYLDKFRGKNLGKSKKLIYGSMILLSTDGFRTFDIGIIRFNDREKIQQNFDKYGYIEIFVEIVNSSKSLIQNYEYYSKISGLEILESKCYFEAYYYVLKTLKSLEVFPLSELIVYCKISRNIQAEYILNNININTFIQEKINSYELHSNQKKAVEIAFSKKLSIIQGPPGTGKTYVGVKIMDILIQLKKKFKSPKGPIFVVCFTNHALDQFLMKILGFSDKICRLGGRTKEDALKNYTLNSLVRLNNIKKNTIYHQIKKELGYFLDQMNRLSSKFMFLEHLKICSTDKLAEMTEMDGSFYEVLKKRYEKEVKAILKTEKRIKIKKSFKNLLDTMTQYFDFAPYLFWLNLIDLKYILKISKNKEKTKEIEKFYDQEELFSENMNDEPEIIEQELYQQKNRHLDNFIKDNIWMKNFLYSKSCIRFDNFSNMLEVIQEFRKNLIENQNQIQIQNEFEEEAREFYEISNNKNYNEKKLFDLSPQSRWKLNEILVKAEKKELKSKIEQSEAEIKRYQEQLKTVEKENETNLLNKLDIIAMTTTGAVKYKNIMQKIYSEVIIVEEAAEVLESQIISSMSPNIKHMILIGDHFQLKPSANSFDLVQNYNFDVSLFERLINNKFENVMMNEQRRMRPEVSDLVKFIYKDLKNHSSALNRPNIRGVPKNVFFFNHKNEEMGDFGTGSKINKYEAEMIVNFANYLVLQKYHPSSITILSLYNGQLLLLKSLVNKKPLLRGILVKTVDNYQGEENDIIILSLVRSNKKNNIGFLKVMNRVCVALSRAKMGMFIFGNASTIRNAVQKPNSDHTINLDKIDFERKLTLWEKILEHLKNNKSLFNNEIEFSCQNHKKSVIVKQPEDFGKMKNGGCEELCEVRLECGHSCKEYCHFYNITETDQTGHNNYKCISDCNRPMKYCDHECDYKCFECKKEKMPCRKIVYKDYDCGHMNELVCDFYQKNKGKCFEQCSKKLKCGHKCKKKCFEKCKKLSKELSDKNFISPCTKKIEKELSCGHIHLVPCGLPIHVFEKSIICDKICNHKLDACNHLCKGKCFECKKNLFHKNCSFSCKNVLICNHGCKDPCIPNNQNACSPCQQQCEILCNHSKCTKKCGEICQNCFEPCKNKCKHQECTKKCYEECDRPPCKKKCRKRLECDHKCIGLCGDDCPPVCRECDPKNEVFEVFFGNEDDPKARFVYLPDCGHTIEVEAMEKHMKIEFEKQKIQYPTCPKCKKGVKKCLRYQKYIKRTNIQINAVKQKILDNISNFKNQIQESVFDELQLGISKLHLKHPFNKKIDEIYQSLLDKYKKIRISVCIGYAQIDSFANLLNIFAHFIQVMELIPKKESQHYEIFTGLNFFLEVFSSNYLDNYKFTKLRNIVKCLEVYLNIEEFFTKNDNNILGSTFDKDQEMLEIIQALISLKNLFLKQNFVSIEENIKMAENYLKKNKLFAYAQKKFKETIIKAINLPKGHWFTCPNGHYYCIGECGGAMEEAKCPECNVTIGGTQHRLTQGNRRASHFDGSVRDAYNTDNDEEIARRLQNQLNMN